jgi:hypothetical protein
MNAETKVKAASFSADVVNAFSEIEGAAKDKLNPHFKSKYADLTSVIGAIKPVLSRHNLAFYQRPQPSESGILVQTILRHASGEEIDLGTLYVPANKQDAQGFGSAMTYARRYGLMTAFGVPAEDDDGSAAAKATANPTTGEPPPVKRRALDGPYTSRTALQAAIRAFAESLRVYSDDLAGFKAWMGTPEVVELEKQAMRDLPGWWDTGEGCATDFEPMTSRIHRKRKELEEVESIISNSGADFIRAG